MSTASGLIFNIQKYSLHDGPGIRTTVFLKGCPLRCRWCSNPESQSAQIQSLGDGPDSQYYTVPQVVNTCLQDKAFYEESGGGVTLSGGEPLSQAAFALELLAALKAEGLHTAIETTGCVSPEVLMNAANLADLILYDVKHYDTARHKEGASVGNELILANLQRLVSVGYNVLPRLPVIPGFNDTTQDAQQFALLLKELGLMHVQLLPFHQMGDKKYALLGVDYALQGVKPLYPEDLADYQAAFASYGVKAFF